MAICLAACAAVLGLIVPAGTANAEPLKVNWGFGAGLQAGLRDWNGSPAGANDWSCRPSAAHPEPVVLVPSTLTSISMDFAALAPYLRNEGYCVFALNYGQDPFVPPGLIGLDDPVASARTVAEFAEKVLATTGAAKLDLIGHSQGGILARYYTEVLGGAPKVRTYLGLGSPYRVDQGFNLVSFAYNLVHLLPNADEIIHRLADRTLGVLDLANGELWNRLNARGGTTAGVNYLTIGSRTDFTIPADTLVFPPVPNAKNLWIQDYCATDATGHFGLAADLTVADLILNQLDPAHPRQPGCRVVLPSP
ncbi:esterase/lipase family protein [Amycolatopsis anabasis]|uniref:esterase/lipase family protein n=1 Tax=Amycolatopsis anabasis TaxID=1840409 RepID=UPI00131C3A51|nr:alpha/beta fold hydrolase [Amycolatopsis anabasis]